MFTTTTEVEGYPDNQKYPTLAVCSSENTGDHTVMATPVPDQALSLKSMRGILEGANTENYRDRQDRAE